MSEHEDNQENRESMIFELGVFAKRVDRDLTKLERDIQSINEWMTDFARRLDRLEGHEE